MDTTYKNCWIRLISLRLGLVTLFGACARTEGGRIFFVIKTTRLTSCILVSTIKILVYSAIALVLYLIVFKPLYIVTIR